MRALSVRAQGKAVVEAVEVWIRLVDHPRPLPGESRLPDGNGPSGPRHGSPTAR